jgi:hypothetical protein
MTSQFLEVPDAWLALLVQHLASGPGGLANAAALTSTCKALHSLCEGPAVTYRNLIFATPISSPDHPLWQWLSKRSGRIDGLKLDLCLEDDDEEEEEVDADEDTDDDSDEDADESTDGDEDDDDDATENAEQLLHWMQPLQTLSSIPGTQLRLKWSDLINRMSHPCIAQWLREHGQLISHLTVEVYVSESLTLGGFSKAAAAAVACQSIDLKIWHAPTHVVDLAELDAVDGCFHSLSCEVNQDWAEGTLRGASVFNSMSQLRTLHLRGEHFEDHESWDLLANLTSLQQLSLLWCTSGDPSPVSALTRLTSLTIHTWDPWDQVNVLAPFSFSNLQPLSTLQQLEVLYLGGRACAATSLQGLAGLSNLKVLTIDFDSDGSWGGMLRSLDGISPGVVEFTVLHHHPNLLSLAGIECCTSMEKLSLRWCGVSSLQPLRGLSSLKSLEVIYCDGLSSLQPLSQLGEGLQMLEVSGCGGVQEEVLELPHVQPTADLDIGGSNLKEVVLAGGVRRAVLPR